MSQACRVFLIAFLLILAGAVSVIAKDYQEIDAASLKVMMEKENVLVVFPLSVIEFNDLHIRGSVQMPLEELERKLPANKDQKLVFYCLGEKCTASWRAAEIAVKLGYRNVYAFRGGLPAWTAAGYPTDSVEKLPEVKLKTISIDELQSQLKSEKDLVLLDVCLELDAKKFWIDTPKRLHIPADDIPDHYSEIPRNKKIAVICLKGTRSPIIVRYLTAKGFKNLVTVEGGMQKWLMDGKPVKTSGG